ncbi:DUF4145 domain-containing protein [Rhodococcus sp. 14-2483-1-2]|uniref:DUF4145 domain-containing protein n=1 Tax=Rhodococcus sp. 14-2483-1-2 TaxID=2023147 RepID=UPI000B9C3952|nr:DUF4145 domain-containing protein [Rhodococcus sp. 14-2483-1-2]OZF26010.1 hypothetical protein CH295_25535 [Rhodococcus sp. 14-2483-1-2]
MVKRHARELSAAFQDGFWPSIECPECQSGVLAVPKKVDKPAEDDISLKYRWELRSYDDDMDITGVFTVHLRCTRASCAAVVAVFGEMFVDVNENYVPWDDSRQLESFYRVRNFYPPVLVAECTDAVPDEVVQQLRRVGALVWMDAPAAMTAVRSAVEALMTAQGVSATTRSGKFRSLDDRLDEFAGAEPGLELFLRAAKWVGNEGTHVASTVTATDVLDMVEYVEIALSALYAPDHAAAVARAGRILAAKRLVP